MAQSSKLPGSRSMVLLGFGIQLSCQNSRWNIYQTSDAEMKAQSRAARLVFSLLCSEQTNGNRPDCCLDLLELLLRQAAELDQSKPRLWFWELQKEGVKRKQTDISSVLKEILSSIFSYTILNLPPPIVL
ncbi:hypothetical protein NQZ68_039183, partial [Dissostichus eleginoides]